LNGAFIGSEESVFMKNALMAVLVIAVCYEHTRAQDIPQRSPGYIKYQGTYPTKVGKGSSTKNNTTDGAVATDKLANDIFISNITADGTVTTDKLAGDILHSMNAGNRHGNANASPASMLPASVNSIWAFGICYYAELERDLGIPKSLNKKSSTGWLQYKVD
jgi:hypothetical protein